MYTRCPECQTAFKITIAQLKARDGLVRCGRCDSIFRADLHLFAPPRMSSRRARAAEEETEFTISEQEEESRSLDLGEKEIPVVSDLSIFQAPRQGVPPLVWAAGALLLLALLVGQFAYFYRNELAQLPQLRPYLARFCDIARCQLVEPARAAVPELLQTRIAPHPRYANALRIRASLVNRTAQAQDLPLVEVSLTDSNGALLARRTFAPREYLESRATAGSERIAPNVMVAALLDITNPDGKAAGYEVQLLPQQRARPN